MRSFGGIFMKKYEYLYRVKVHDRYENHKKYTNDIWAVNKASIKKKFDHTSCIDSCEKVLDKNGKAIKREIEEV